VSWLVAGALLPSLLIAWIAGYGVRSYAPRLGLVDQPGHRKVHKSATPLGGGLAIWLGVVAPFALGSLAIAVLGTEAQAAWLPEFVAPHLAGLRQQLPKLWTVLAGGTVLMLLGLADDRRGVDWKPRLAIEFAVAGFMVWQGWRLSLFIDLPWLTALLSVLWIVTLVNSFNLLDNMDGLSGGVAAIASSILAATMLTTPDPGTNQPQLFVGGFLLVLVGALLGFLLHNRPTARLFMGDAGAYFIGYLIAIATMMATFAGGSAPRHAIFAPLCVLAVPLYDLVSVVVIRLRSGRSPFVGDTSHFSHRLVDLGLSKPQAVLTIYLTTAATGLGALLLYQVDAFGASVIGLMVAAELAVIAILEATARARREP